MSDTLPALQGAALPIGGNRLAYLDNLRASLVALVICHHANAAYGSPGGWYYIVHESGGLVTEILTTMFAGITQAFFMSSFFLISAYFTPPAYDYKGPWRFTWRRLIRLGIPLLAYYYVLSVLMDFFVSRFRGRTEYGFFEFFTTHFLHRMRPARSGLRSRCWSSRAFTWRSG